MHDQRIRSMLDLGIGMTHLVNNPDIRQPWRARLEDVLGINQTFESREKIEGLDYFLVLYRRRAIVAASILVCIVAGFCIGLFLIPQFTATATAVPSTDDPAQATAGSALSGLALLSGHSEVTRKDTAIALLNSRSTLQLFISQHNLLPILFQDRWDKVGRKWKEGVKPPTLEDGFLRLKGREKIEQDSVANLVRVNVAWPDATIAASWANDLMKMTNHTMQTSAIIRSERMIAYLNGELDHIQNQDVHTAVANLIQEQIKVKVLAKSTDSYALIVIDPAFPTTTKSSLGKGVLMVLGAFIGLVFSVPLAFLLEAMAGRKKIRP